MIKREKVNRAEILIELQQNEFKVLKDTVRKLTLTIPKDHPNIMRVFELLEDEKNFFIVSE